MSESKTVSRSTVYAKATAILREKHREEFDSILTAQFAAAGMTYKRRKTAEEREAEAAEARLAKARAKALALKAEFGDDIFSEPPF